MPSRWQRRFLPAQFAARGFGDGLCATWGCWPDARALRPHLELEKSMSYSRLLSTRVPPGPGPQMPALAIHGEQSRDVIQGWGAFDSTMPLSRPIPRIAFRDFNHFVTSRRPSTGERVADAVTPCSRAMTPSQEISLRGVRPCGWSFVTPQRLPRSDARDRTRSSWLFFARWKHLRG